MSNLPSGFGKVPTTPDLSFKIPNRIALDDYPKVIKDFRKHIIELRKQHLAAERIRDQRENLLRKSDYTRLGSNKEEREAAFAIHLEGDEIFTSARSDVDALYWAIEDQKVELEEVIENMTNLRLKHRMQVVASELFGGVPVTDAETFRA